MTPPEDWAHLPFFRDDWPQLREKLACEPGWLPGPERIFAALEATAPENTRVVILGQDPYPTPGHANGLAFSVNKCVALPRSLKNIFTEMQSDIGSSPSSGDLGHWAQQGVLLLNTSLTVPAGKAGAHAKWGWDKLARQAIAEAQQHGPIAFLLWGAHAQKAVQGLPRAEDFTLATAHPSPLSAQRGFFGSKPFSRINDWLCQQGKTAINWAG